MLGEELNKLLINSELFLGYQPSYVITKEGYHLNSKFTSSKIGDTKICVIDCNYVNYYSDPINVDIMLTISSKAHPYYNSTTCEKLLSKLTLYELIKELDRSFEFYPRVIIADPEFSSTYKNKSFELLSKYMKWKKSLMREANLELIELQSH